MESFNDLVEAIASRKYFAGVMTSDVAAAHQDMLFKKNLRIVRRYESKIPMNTYAFEYASLTKEQNQMTECFSTDGVQDYIVTDTFDKYRTYIKVSRLFYNSSLLRQNSYNIGLI